MTTPNDFSTRQPLYHAYCVIDGARGQKYYWTRIGTAFRHDDGDGLTVLLNGLPVNGRLVLRKPLPPEEAAPAADADAMA